MERANEQTIIVFGDIHGRKQWFDVLTNQPWDHVVFLGDYVSTHDDITPQDQIDNLNNILNFKRSNPDSVTLLRGNHDMQHLGYAWAECSGLERDVLNWMSEHRDEFLELTQWVHIIETTDEKYVLSHAGVSKLWLMNNELTMQSINKLEPSEIFAFTPDHPWDMYGYSPTQPPTWIRPDTLINHLPEGWNQIVGHTPVYKIVNIPNKTTGNSIWLCDCMPTQYLKITLSPTKFETEPCYI